jgi:hypothetical protein
MIKNKINKTHEMEEAEIKRKKEIKAGDKNKQVTVIKIRKERR